ncbi:hypothetical protein N2152v2_008548 [Parachlorella kessleri]
MVPASPSVTFGDSIPINLATLLRSGDISGGATFGELVSATGQPIYLQTPSSLGAVDVSVNPDYQSFHKVGSNLYLLSHFESPQPAPIYLTQVTQDQNTGALKAVSTKPVNLTGVGGGWNLCAGSVTPWNSQIGGEEYEPDARLFEQAASLDKVNSAIIDFVRYYDLYLSEGATLGDVKAEFQPYKYGHVIEVKVNPDGTPSVTKWYTLGRNSKETAYIMPDNKTVYITDDGTNVGFFKFIATTAGDLSQGDLYAAKFSQQNASNGGTFGITWIKLGSASQSELQSKVESLTFSQIFDYATPTNGTGACPSGYKSINAGDPLEECLKLKDGADKWAAFFETRRYAAYLGATTEFSKWEGITYSPSRNKLYTALTEIRYGMEDNAKKGKNDTEYDIGSNNDIRLPYNPCGCVYSIDVDAQYNANKMQAIVCGNTVGLVDANNTCSVESISSPDNVAMMDSYSTLLIAEDTEAHLNNYVWAYNLDTGSLTRIVSTPVGAEATGVWFFENLLNGWSYISVAAQHPTDNTSNPYNQGPAGYVGYFAIQTSAINGKSIQFTPLPTPRTEMAESYFNGTSSLIAGVTSNATYKTLWRSGDNINGVVMGSLLDVKGQPIKAVNDTTLLPGDKNEISNSTDHTSILNVCQKLHLVSQHEDVPALMYSMDLTQASDGTLTVANPKVVDWSKDGGLWDPCSGEVTPWQTHLGSEEYEPDAKTIAFANSIDDIRADTESGDDILKYMRYWDFYLPTMTVDDVKAYFKPYRYGHVTEVFVDGSSCARGVKHYAMGRGSIEMAHVLGDNKTVIISEDGQCDAFYKFVADKAGDLSAGTLYAAKFKQNSADNGGDFDVTWIELGHGMDADLQEAAATLNFTDIFDLVAPDGSGKCPSGYSSVNTGYAGQECLMLKPGMEDVAPFLETRRYAAMKGASTEFNKVEGTAYDQKGGRLFLSITSVEKGMEDNAGKGKNNTKYDIGSNNDIRLPWNPCGCVYVFTLDANYSPNHMKGLVCGKPVNATNNLGNGCDLEGIANPDNLSYMPGTGDGNLLIAEDTDSHQNDVMWQYNLDSGVLTRTLSTPYGSEVTSTEFYENVGGYGYVVDVVQHPYGESDQDKVTEAGSTGQGAWIGYMGPFKNTGGSPEASVCSNVNYCPASTYSAT